MLGPWVVRPSISPIAQRWRLSASRVETARVRSSAFQSPPAGGRLDLAEDDVDHPVEEVVLVGDVVVERHRLDAELLGELAHRELLRPALVGQRDRGAQHPLPVERRPSRVVSWVVTFVVLRAPA